MKQLVGKVALVTGASRGIGRSIAIELGKAGAAVIVNYNSNKQKAEEVVEIIKEHGSYAIPIQCDVSENAAVRDMVQEVISKFGKIDILVNNAGISHVGLFIDTEEDVWDDIISKNVKSVYNTCKYVSEYMLKEKSGSIINISSIWGESGASCEVAYSASKGAVNSFTKALGKELAPSNIRVNAVAPGIIKTDMNNWLSEEEEREITDEIPIGRMGTTEEVANLVVYLSSEASKYIVSQVITLDGGWI